MLTPTSILDALAAGDPIQAVIRKSLLNQDGKTDTITAPSLEAQEALARGCYRKAGLDPRDTQYFVIRFLPCESQNSTADGLGPCSTRIQEAHGTGTQVGDTIEARAVANVFASRREPLLIGSIKTNVGHTGAASGLGSIIKTVLAMEKGLIPPSINFAKPNPKLALEEWNLRLVKELQKWPAVPTRRASINNFGYGGTNAHIIIEDGASWVPTFAGTMAHSNGHFHGYSNGHGTDENHVETNGHRQLSCDGSKVLVLSGKNEQACQRVISNLMDFLERQKSGQSDPREFLESLAYTLGQRRTVFPWVAAHPVPVTEGIDAVIQALQSPKFKTSRNSRRPRIGMVFTGQGAQWHAMGKELVDAYPVYKASLEEAEGYLREFGPDWSLMEELSRDDESSRVNDVGLNTSLCAALQITRTVASRLGSRASRCYKSF